MAELPKYVMVFQKHKKRTGSARGS